MGKMPQSSQHRPQQMTAMRQEHMQVVALYKGEECMEADSMHFRLSLWMALVSTTVSIHTCLDH
jgi:hypothetical protein